MILFDKKEALPEVQQRIVPQKANEHFALKVTKQQKNLSYILFSYFARSLDFCQKTKLSNHDTFFWIFVF